MPIQFPARERFNNNTEKLIDSIEEYLAVLVEAKNINVKYQKYEKVVELRDIERHLEILLDKLREDIES
jgi:hypothetical protein